MASDDQSSNAGYSAAVSPQAPASQDLKKALEMAREAEGDDVKSVEEDASTECSFTSHYDELGNLYEQAWFYNDDTPYQRWYVDAVVRHLELASDDHLADIGGGTGNFTVKVRAVAGMVHDALVVEPALELMKQAEGREGVQAVCQDAGEFAIGGSAKSYNKLLFKEVIHHIPLKGDALGQLHENLPDGAVILVVTRPKDSSHYPFFEGAHKEWSAHQPESEECVAAFRAAGFSEVTVTTEAFQVSIEKGWWFQMIRDRFWSNFSTFSDAQIEAGIAKLDRRFPGEDSRALNFDDRLVFIVAKKN